MVNRYKEETPNCYQEMKLAEKGNFSSLNSPLNLLIIKYARREAKRTIHFNLQLVTYEYLRWRGLSTGEKNAYNERLAKWKFRGIGVPRLVDWNVFEEYDCEDEFRELMKIKYMHEDGATQSYEGNSIILSSGYEIEGS
ncbi:hypothetical protein Tco_0817102 [Tanacetum coccineum]